MGFPFSRKVKRIVLAVGSGQPQVFGREDVSDINAASDAGTVAYEQFAQHLCSVKIDDVVSGLTLTTKGKALYDEHLAVIAA